MAQTATRFAKRPSRSRSSRLNDVAPAVEEAREELRTIALRLAPLVAPYRRHGRLSIRVERMSQLARLSQGRNNGDGSWSLGSDELEDLIYLLPQSFNDPHTLAIRIIGLEGGAATTLALIDLPVSLDDSTSEAAFDPHAGGPAEATDLHREVARLRTELAARNGELAEARRMADAAIAGFSQQLEAELAKMRAAFAAELDERLAAAAVEAAAELQERREAWQAEHSAKLGVSEARERERMAELRERWQRETEAAILKAEKAWKSEEAKRSEAREREWQEKLQEALAQAEAGRSVARGDSDEAVARLRETVARLQAALAQHEAELDQAKREKDEAQRHWQAALQAALLDAERRWQEAESARAQAAERLWQSRIAEAVAEAQADKARSEQSAKAEHRRLEEEVSNLRARLAEREQALDQVRSSAEEAQKQWLRRNADALAKAEAEWRQAEIARFAAAQAEWEQRLARGAWRRLKPCAKLRMWRSIA